MAYTSFGEFVRILRIKRKLVMGDMADMLNTSIPFLSAVENGKKNVPEGWFEKLVALFELQTNEQSELKQAIEESKTQYKIKTLNASQTQRKVAMQFARSFDDLDDETADKILELLTKKKEKTKNGL